MSRAEACLAVCVFGMLFHATSCHESEKPGCQVGHGKVCQTGSVLVQTLAVRQRSEEVINTFGEQEQDESSQTAEGFGSTLQKHGAFQISTVDDSYDLGDGKKRWIVYDPEADPRVVSKLVNECKPSSMKVIYAGKRDVIMEGTEEEIKEELDACRKYLSADTMVEADAPMALIPEMPNTEEHVLESSASSSLWGLDRIDDRRGLDSDYSPPNTGEGVHVFVADTGIRVSHKDFGNRAIPAIDVTSGNVKKCGRTDTNCANDKQGHGTHCAGTIGGETYGVAKKVKLHAVKVLNDRGSGSFSWFVEALDWVVDEAADLRPGIFSASLGGKGSHPTTGAAIDKATKAGVMVVVAAGNDRDDACRYTPAGVGSAITVGSTTSSDSRSGFSNYGRCLDIFAPGSDIYSAGHRSNTDRQMMSGTSMACPHVAGAAALLFEENPDMPVREAETKLKDSATKGKVTDAKVKSPNLLLFVGTDNEPPNPAPTPPPQTPAPAPGGCKDQSNRCAIWQKRGRCKKFGVRKKCQKTCKACCMDLQKRCPRLKKRCSEPAIKKNCPLTCEMCSK